MQKKFIITILLTLILLFGYFPYIMEILYNKYSYPIFVPLITTTAIFSYIITIVLIFAVIKLHKKVVPNFFVKITIFFIPLSWIFIFVVKEGDMYLPDREGATWIMNTLLTSVFFLSLIGKYFLKRDKNIFKWR